MQVIDEQTADGTFITRDKQIFPEVWDILIAGGGPAGTATAFRAKELGLKALVIDYDDLLRRLRDYPKEKLILPDFGGGDKMRFPDGGDAIKSLRFEPVDKDELVSRWKGFYHDYNIPAKIGLELTSLMANEQGLWCAKVWNENTKTTEEIKAKSVVLSIGKGVPRRFDIPGNTDGITGQLKDPAKYVGAPALVIGGGTSAAEAVIAISNAKIEAEDASSVFWSYRGDKMPRVSKALTDAYFTAFVRNGNVRYYPKSDPMAVLKHADGVEYLSICIDRSIRDGKPVDVSCLEFLKQSCIACIGEDVPENFLNSMGIPMATMKEGGRKRFLVNPELETIQPLVYLTGDLLNQAYYQAPTFPAGPELLKQVGHKGNIKAAFNDGVQVAETIFNKLNSQESNHVALASKPEPDHQVQISVDKTPVEPAPIAEQTQEDGRKTECLGPLSIVKKAVAFLTLELKNGKDIVVPLTLDKKVSIGTTGCTININNDRFVSRQHAAISPAANGFELEDCNSSNGTFLKLEPEVPFQVSHGDIIRVGKQFLQFMQVQQDLQMVHINLMGQHVKTYRITQKTLSIGREALDISLDPDDDALSRNHLSASLLPDGRVVIKDLKSMNGSFWRVRTKIPLKHGSRIRTGDHILSFSLGTPQQAAPMQNGNPPGGNVTSFSQPARMRNVPQQPAQKTPPLKSGPRQATPGSVAPVPVPAQKLDASAPSPARPARQQPAKSTGEALVLHVKNLNKKFSFKKGQTICDVLEENGIPVIADCHEGICGSDPILILSGEENLNAMNDDEADVVENMCERKPGECRLACMAIPTGEVEIEVLS